MKSRKKEPTGPATARLCALILSGLVAAFLGLSTTHAQSSPLIVADSQRADWAAIGKVNIHGYRSRGACTGTLIAPDRVLTAAHCLVNPETLRPYPIYRVQFVAGWHKGAHFGTAKARAIRLHPDYDMSTENKRRANPKNTGRDVAIIELAEALTDIQPAAIAETTWRGGDVALLGYRRDRPHILSDYTGCNALAPLGGILLVSCTVVEGTSGAPILTRSDKGWAIIGVVSARRDAPRGPRTLGASVTEPVIDLILPGGS